MLQQSGVPNLMENIGDKRFSTWVWMWIDCFYAPETFLTLHEDDWLYLEIEVSRNKLFVKKMYLKQQSDRGHGAYLDSKEAIALIEKEEGKEMAGQEQAQAENQR